MNKQEPTGITDSAPALIATRYLALIGCVILLWDHLLTLGNEIKCIWRLRMGVAKGVFLFNRYFVEGALLYNVYILLDLHGKLSEEICRTYISFVSSTSTFAITFAILVVTIHIHSLWDRRTAVTYTLFAGFCITYGVTIVSAVLVIKDFRAHITWVPEINACVIPHKPMPLIGAWAGMVTYDIFMLVMMFANAVNKPYRQAFEVVRNLHSDGAKFLATLLFVRLVNLVLAILSTPEEMLVIVFLLWAVVSIILSRFLLMVQAVKKDTASKEEGSEYDDDCSKPATPFTPATKISFQRDKRGKWSRGSDLIELNGPRHDPFGTNSCGSAQTVRCTDATGEADLCRP